MIDETLSPTWDELLMIDDVTVYGSPEAICREPPTVVIEVFDQDKMVSASTNTYTEPVDLLLTSNIAPTLSSLEIPSS